MSLQMAVRQTTTQQRTEALNESASFASVLRYVGPLLLWYFGTWVLWRLGA